MDAFILTAPGVIARIRTVTLVRLGVATLNYATPSPPPQKKKHTYVLLICSSRVASFLMSDRVR